MCKTCRDYAEEYCHKYIHVYIFPCAISHLKQVIQSVCSKQTQGLGEITCHPLETSVNNEPSQYFSLNYIQEAKSSNSISIYAFPHLQLKLITILKHQGSLKGSP